jgi:hypothetical protein
MMVFQVNGVAVLPPDLARPEKARSTKRMVMMNMAQPPMLDKTSIDLENLCSSRVKRIKMTKVMAVNMAVERNFGSSNSSVPVNPQPTSTKRQLAVSTT